MMGPMFGIFNYGYETYPSYKYDHDLGGFYPSQPVLTGPQWQSILDYYTALSPDTLDANKMMWLLVPAIVV